MTRRDLTSLILRAISTTAGAEFFTAWSQTHPHSPNSEAPPEPDRWSSYQPKFFSPEEFTILDVFTAILIPTDETPGAREAHVTPFIDFVVNAAAEYAPEMQKQWREAFAWLRAQNFAALSLQEQLALVQQMSEPERDPSKKRDDGFAAYHLIKEMTVHAFYTSRVGLVDVLEYKGNAYLLEFPGCDHPEHHRL